MITAQFSEVLVLGYVKEMIQDGRTNTSNPWHRLDGRDEASGRQMYLSLSDPNGKSLSDDERKAAADLLAQVEGLSMGDRIKVAAEVNPEITSRGGQLVKFKLRKVEPQAAQLSDRQAKAA